ncbi:MAG: MBL fold metallo-hydrolase [Bacillota bacterium]|nr:MBL fold metallo-hydrolase [Bacillota bacterium]
MLTAATLFSNSKGNSVFVASGKTKILIDAGVSACHIERALANMGESIGDIAAILITHEHIDHVRSAGTLSRRYDIPICAAPKVWEEYSGFGNIKLKNQVQYEYGMAIGDLELDFFKTYHDAIQPLGITVTNGKHKLGVCTDTGKITDTMVKALRDSEVLVFEANHDPEMLRRSSYPAKTKRRISSEWGHLSNADSGQALVRIITDKTRCIALAHLSDENNDPQLAYATVMAALEDEGVDKMPKIQVAPAGHTSKVMVIE